MPDMSLQVALAGILAYLQEYLKRSPSFGFLTHYSQSANKAFSLFLAVLTTVGLTVGWVVDPATQLGTFTLGGIPTTLDGATRMLLIAVEQYWFQKAWFKGIIRDESAQRLSVPLAGKGY